MAVVRASIVRPPANPSSCMSSPKAATWADASKALSTGNSRAPGVVGRRLGSPRRTRTSRHAHERPLDELERQRRYEKHCAEVSRKRERADNGRGVPVEKKQCGQVIEVH